MESCSKGFLADAFVFKVLVVPPPGAASCVWSALMPWPSIWQKKLDLGGRNDSLSKR